MKNAMFSPELAPTPAHQVEPSLSELTVVDNYHIEGLLASTPSAEVYSAINKDHGHPVALKVVHPSGDKQGLIKERLMHQKVEHNAHVVKMDGYGTIEGRPYIATNLQEGGTLLSDLKKISGAPTEAYDISSVIKDMRNGLRQTTPDDYPTEEIQAWGEVKGSFGTSLIEEVDQNIKRLEIISPNSLIHVVADAIHDLGYDINPDSVLTREMTLDIVENLPSLNQLEVPDEETVLRRINILRGVAEGVLHLHRQGIFHRDIKLANTGINLKGEGVIIDLGVATMVRRQSHATSYGTFINFAPEAYDGQVSAKGESYALGNMAYKALSGIQAFPVVEDLKESLHIKLNTKPKHICEVNPNVQPDVGDAIMLSLHPSPMVRASVASQAIVYRAAS